MKRLLLLVLIFSSINLFNVNAMQEEQLHKELFDAIQLHNLQEVRSLLRNIENVNIKNNNEETPLYWAVRANQLEIVQLLLNNGAKASVNMTSRFGDTPLYWAIRNENPQMIQLLLDSGANVNITNNYQETPLYVAVAKGNLEIVLLLLRNGADESINIAENIDENTPLHFAASNNNNEIIEVLLSYGALKDKENTMGKTPGKGKDVLPEIRKLIEDYIPVHKKTKSAKG
jgi:ankyrin repeat protein